MGDFVHIWQFCQKCQFFSELHLQTLQKSGKFGQIGRNLVRHHMHTFSTFCDTSTPANAKKGGSARVCTNLPKLVHVTPAALYTVAKSCKMVQNGHTFSDATLEKTHLFYTERLVNPKNTNVHKMAEKCRFFPFLGHVPYKSEANHVTTPKKHAFFDEKTGLFASQNTVGRPTYRKCTRLHEMCICVQKSVFCVVLYACCPDNCMRFLLK
jgi:hypothetical protein